MTIDHTLSAQAAVYKDVPRNILDSVRAASRRTGVDFSYLMEKAAAESSFDNQAQASTSSARGLYQFTRQTWLDMVAAHGQSYGLGSYAAAIKNGSLDAASCTHLLSLRDNPRLSAAMAAEYTKDNAGRLEGELGRKAGATDLYLAHFLGGGGACKFLKAMDADASTPAAGLLPEAAAANQAVFYDNGHPRSLGEIYDYFSGKFSKSAAGAPSTGATPDLETEAAVPSGEGLVASLPAAISPAHAPAHVAALSRPAAMPTRAERPDASDSSVHGISTSSLVRPVPRKFTAPPAPNSQLGMATILYLASLDPLPSSSRRI